MAERDTFGEVGTHRPFSVLTQTPDPHGVINVRLRLFALLEHASDDRPVDRWIMSEPLLRAYLAQRR